MCNQCALHNKFRINIIAGGQNSSRDRQTVFFTAVNPMNKDHKDRHELDLTKSRLASYKQKWKVHQDTVYWVDIQLAQRKGLKFYQRRCNAVILYDTLQAYCISKAIVMKSEEIIFQKENVSSRPPPTISFKDNWMKNWIQKSLEAAKTPTNPTKTQNPIIKNGETRGWTRVHQGGGARH